MLAALLVAALLSIVLVTVALLNIAEDPKRVDDAEARRVARAARRRAYLG